MRFSLPATCLVFLSAVHLSAQTVWTASGIGDFTVDSNWSSRAPNSSTDAAITNGTLATPTIVNLNRATGNVANLTLGSFNTLNVNLGSVFVINGSLVTNGGALNVTAGSGKNALVQFAGNTTFQGGGTVTLNSGDNNGLVYLQQSTGGVTLTNVDNTIQGYGIIGQGGLTVVNNAAGTINANVSGQTLLLNGTGNVANSGLLEATNGGTLHITNVINNASSNINANGGNVAIDGNATIVGGALNSLNGGTVGVAQAQTANLDGSSHGALTLHTDSPTGTTWTGGLGSTTYVQGTINNNGNIQLNAGSGHNTILDFGGNTTLQGGGTVTLNSGDINGLAYLEQATGGVTLTNVDHTIQGYGVIGNGGLTVINQATINANVSGRTLLLNGSGNVTNSGLLEATNGGTLHITNVINNAGFNINANGGNVAIDNNATIVGGTLNSLHGGTVGLAQAQTANLDGSSQGALTLYSDQISGTTTWTGGLGSTTYVQGTINNNGNIQVNAGGGRNTILDFGGNTTLQGGGTVTMNSGDTNGLAYLEQGTGGVTLTNVDHTIQGYGVIGNGGLTVINQATINANVSGQTLLLNGGGNVTNSGLLEATNGGTLHITNLINNAGFNINANGGNVAIDNNATIVGGALNSLNGGTVGVAQAQTANLDGSSQGALTLYSDQISGTTTWTGGLGSTTYVQGTINNNGNIQVNAGGGHNTILDFGRSTTLQGGGTVTMNSGDTNGLAYLEQSTGGVTLTNADHKIQGYGVIGNGGLTVVNGAAGTLLANSAGNTLLINGSGGLTNNGTLQANAGSTLQVTSAVANFSGNTLTGGTYVANGTSDIAGTVQLNLGSNLGGEIVNNAAAIVLNGPTANTRFLDSNGHGALANLAANLGASSGFTVEGGYGFQTVGDFTNAGIVVVAGTGSSLTIGPSGNNAYNQAGGNTLVNPGGVLSAQAVNLRGGNLVVGSSGALGSSPVSVSGGSLYVNNNATLINALTYGIGTLGGLGTFAPAGGVVIGASRAVAPGISINSLNLGNTAIGTLSFGTGLTLASGGTYVWELGDASGVAGTGWDAILVAGTLTISAPTAPYTLTVLPASSDPAYAGPFVFHNNQPYSWSIASATGGIAGFNSNAFAIDSTAFSGLLGGGQLSLSQTGNDLVLNFTPVPEPSTYALMGLGLIVAVASLRRRKLQAR